MQDYTINLLDGAIPVYPHVPLGIVLDDGQPFATGTDIPPDEAQARLIAQQAARWLAFAAERTRMRPATITQKAIDAACFSVLKRASSLAIPSKLSGVGAHQRQLWAMTRNRVPVWTPLALDPGEKRVAVLYDGEVIGHVQPKHHAWIKPLIPFGARLYLSRITGSERSGYTLGVNVVVGHVGAALDRLLGALGEAGFGRAGGDGISGAGIPGGDGASGGLRLVTSAPNVAKPQGDTAQVEADPDDVVCYRDIDGTSRATVEHVVRHSPSGIEWGYHGSGPADLAWSVLLAFTDEATAERLYQAFKAEVVALVPKGGGVIRAADVRAWLAARGTDRQ